MLVRWQRTDLSEGVMLYQNQHHSAMRYSAILHTIYSLPFSGYYVCCTILRDTLLEVYIYLRLYCGTLLNSARLSA